MSLFDKYTANSFTDDPATFISVFEHFDKNKDGFIDASEFYDLLKSLLTSGTDKAESLTDEDVASLLALLDLDSDGRLSLNEFQSAWLYWLRQILKPIKALVIVDVQNDFISGSLALSNCPAGQDGSMVVPVINSLLEQRLFDVVVYTYDWHPENHISFIDNFHNRKLHPVSKVLCDDAKLFDTVVFDVGGTPREQTLWPKHCVPDTWGAQLHKDLTVVKNAFHIKKGTKSDVDSYSAFWDNNKQFKTELSSILQDHHVTDLYVCGLAFDVCVGHTVADAVDHGYRTTIIEDACRGVSLDRIAKTRSDLTAKGVYFAQSNQVPNLTRSEYRPLCLAVQAAINYKVAWKMVKEKLLHR